MNEKLKDIFRNKVVNKRLPTNIGGGHIPRYVVEYLIENYCTEENFEEDLRKVERKLRGNFVRGDEVELIRHQIRESRSYAIISSLKIRLQETEDKYWGTISAINENLVNVTESLVRQYPMLLSGGMWGTITLSYDETEVHNKKIRPFKVTEFTPLFTPFQMSAIDVNDYIEKRREFEVTEWIDILVNSVGLNPGLMTRREKLLYMLRLIPLVEANFNCIELGPRSTGKTYLYQNSSYYTHVLSGGKATPASLFINLANGKVGVVGSRDAVVFDEIATTNFNAPKEVVSMMKGYMQDAKFNRGKNEILAHSSIVLVGYLDVQGKLPHEKYYHLFEPLPSFLQDEAFIDRLHCYTPGWEISKIRPDSTSQDYGFIADYFAEIMHDIRQLDLVGKVKSRYLLKDTCADGGGITERDVRGIEKTLSGLLKLLYPHGELSDDQLAELLELAVEGRQRVRNQLHLMAPDEYGPIVLGAKLVESDRIIVPTLPDAHREQRVILPSKPVVGEVVGLGVVGDDRGCFLHFEVQANKGSGRVVSLGSMQKVMKESVAAAAQFVKTHAKNLGLPPDWQDNQDVAVLATMMGIPKEGPSAGITIVTGIASALTGKAVHNNIAMTGEITIMGKVLGVGGILPKLQAAVDAGCAEVIVPYENKKDVDLVPDYIRDKLKVNFASSIEEVLNIALIDAVFSKPSTDVGDTAMTKHADAILQIADSRKDNFINYKVKGLLFSFDLVGFINACKDDGIPIGADELRFILSSLDTGTLDDPFAVPEQVAKFMAQIAEPFSPQAVLNPWAGVGFMDVIVQEHLKPLSYFAHTDNAKDYEVFNLLEESSSIDMTLSEPLQLPQVTNASVDLAIGCLPFEKRSKRSLECEVDGEMVKVTDDFGYLLILESCRQLSEQGVGVFVVPNEFFVKSSSSGRVRHTLERLGIHVVAAIELPHGTFQPKTSISTHIIVLERSLHPDLFTGRFTDAPKQQAELLKNLRHRKNATAPQLGRLVKADSFRSFSSVELRERVEDQARRTGLVPYPISEVVSELSSPGSTADFEGFEQKTNAVYLPQMATTDATTTQEDLPDKLKSYFQLVVNSDIADAEFLARLLNTPFGQLWRDSLRTGDTIPRIGKSAMEGATIYLPPKKSRSMQDKVLECQHTLSSLRNEISELESQLWKRPDKVDTVNSSIRTINHDDGIEAWLDSLPFPLASILWVCHTQAGSSKEQYERKIHFFEALAQFLGVIHLSAFSAHQSLWPDLSERLKTTLETNKLTLERATFGTWKVVIEIFFTETRRLLRDDEEMAFELFKTRNREVLGAITSKRILSLIQATNKLRNDWMGHTGIVSDKDARSVNDLLETHIQTLREVFGVVWEEYELLLPGDCKVRSGVFHFSTKKIMGTRTPFPTDSVSVVEPMEDGHLYLKNPSESRGLKLLPLVKVMSSPKTEENACYFYNRLQPDGIRFLSYYFETDAEVVADFGDVAVCLDNLMESGIKPEGHA